MARVVIVVPTRNLTVHSGNFNVGGQRKGQSSIASELHTDRICGWRHSLRTPTCGPPCPPSSTRALFKPLLCPILCPLSPFQFSLHQATYLYHHNQQYVTQASCTAQAALPSHLHIQNPTVRPTTIAHPRSTTVSPPKPLAPRA